MQQANVWLQSAAGGVRLLVPTDDAPTVAAHLDRIGGANPEQLVERLRGRISDDGLRAVAEQTEQLHRLGAAPTSGLARAALASDARVVVSFAGQAQAWLDELAALYTDPLARPIIEAAAAAVDAELADGLGLTGFYPHGAPLLQWITTPDTRPDADALAAGPISQPFIFLTQIARFATLARHGFVGDRIDSWAVAACGHSQGVQAALLIAEGLAPDALAEKCARWVRLLMRQGVHMQRAWGRTRPSLAMLAVTGPSQAALEPLVDGLAATISLANGPGRHVISGDPADLQRLQRRLDAQHAAAEARAQAGQGQKPVAPTIEQLAVSAPYHSAFMQAALEPLRADIEALAVLPTTYRVPVVRGQGGAVWTPTALDVARAVCLESVQWPATMARLARLDTTHVLDIGPGAGCAALAGLNLAGRGVAVLPLARPDAVSLLARSDVPPQPVAWAEYAPRAVVDGDGVRLVNRWTEAFDRAPIILPGMTPTTVDAGIVAAAANAGFMAELAGGGQPTEAILRRRADELRSALIPGEGYVFNALYLDPHLWNLHLGARRLVPQLKAEGHPIDGVTVSAGLPPVDEALTLLAEWRGLGMQLNSFKAGNDAQIRQVLAIADADDGPVVLQLEGGRAGGHHSFEDLETLLLRWYARIRRRPRVLLAVGGGVATPERVSALLHGTWATAHDRGVMPVDAVFVGTACMAAAEATTSPAVKAALVAAPGTPDLTRRGEAIGGVISGRSGLGADIHYLDNHAARVERLLDAVAGDADAAHARKAEIVAALAQTARPYLGDLAAMTYTTWLTRLVELMGLGRGGAYEDGVWLDGSHRARFGEVLRRALRRCGFTGPLPADDGLDAPADLVDALGAQCSRLATTPVLPEDRRWFVDVVCATPGKPMPFVPVIDGNVHRWYTRDALWQAHDPRYAADAVLVLPGPAGVAGIERADEPIAGLLDRFLGAARIDVGTPAPAPETAAQLPEAIEAALAQGAQRAVDHVAIRHARPAGEPLTLTLPLDRVRRAQVLGRESAARLRAFYRGLMPEAVRFDAERLGAYRRATGDDSPDAPLQLAFALAMPALMQHVLDDRLGVDPLSLLHLSATLERRAPMTDGPIQVAVDAPQITDSPSGRALQFTASLWQADREIACQTQVFLVRRFEGTPVSGPAVAPVSAPTGVPLDRPRPILVDAPLVAPTSMDAFAAASGDLNPIHRDPALAALAGLDAPIVHGQWTAAAAGALLGGRLDAAHTAFLAPVPLGARLTVNAEVVARAAGADIIEMRVSHGDRLVMRQTVTRAADATAVVFPGQGCQRRGMGMAAYDRSAAARAIWDRADAHTRAAHGWSLLEVIRANPRRMRAGDAWCQHPKGVLHLTQFTQVALCTLAVAGVAELRERGVLPRDPWIAGHSVGEYSALAALTDLLPLERVIDVVYARGLTMQNFVPRDAQGRSPYGMAVARPHKAGLDADALEALVAATAERLDLPLYVVNYNVRGRQYAIAGHVDCLAALGAALPADAWVHLPGIDVPFHSPLIASGVDAFRAVLDDCFPADVDVAPLIGRYLPNLVAVPFACTAAFVERMEAAIGQPLPTLRARPETHGRAILIELLAWQFASPVRWIETQDRLLADVRRVVEIGPDDAPVLANMLRSTLRRSDRALEVLHAGADRDAVLGNGPVAVFTEDAVEQPEAAAPVANVPTAPVASTATLDDAPFGVDEAIRALLAVATEQPLGAITGAASLDERLGGNSARRNAILADLGKEFGVGAIDGAHELPLPQLVQAIDGATNGRYRHPGAWLRTAQDAALKGLGLTRKAAEARLRDGWGLPPGRIAAVLTVLVAEKTDLASAVTAYGRIVGETITKPTAQATQQAAPSGEAPAVAQARWKRLARAALTAGGLDPTLVDRPIQPAPHPSNAPDAVGFDAERLVSFTAAEAWARADLFRAFHALERGEAVDFAPMIRAASPAWRAACVALITHASAETAHRLQAAHDAAERAMTAPLAYADETAIITGAGPDSIAEAIAARLLEGGARLIVSTSRMTPARVARFKALYRAHAARGAELHVVPLDQGDLNAIDAFVDWVGAQWRPTLCVPFGAMPAEGDPTTCDARTIRSLHVNLIGVERLVARLGQQAMGGAPVHVLLPLSPNHGQMGRDGLYAEAKAGLEALLPRRQSEARWWGAGVTICGARIGWVRGTGLMAGLDRVYEAVEARLGITTFAPDEMADLLLAECTADARAQGGWIADHTGGLGADAELRPIIEEALRQAGSTDDTTVAAAPLPAALFDFPVLPDAAATDDLALDDVVAIVGYGEIGPFGNARVRWQMERDGALDNAAALELAWLTGCVRFEKGRFVDVASGEPVEAADLVSRYALTEKAGIRDLDAFDPETVVLYDEIVLEEDLRFSAPDGATAAAFRALDPEHTSIFEGADGWQVIRKAGGRIRVPRALPVDRDIAGQIPTGWDARRMGFDAAQVANLDPVAIFNLLATAAAFRCAGLTPEDLAAAIPAHRIGCSVGSGMGGMRAIQRLYAESKLVERRQTDALQESLINVTAAYPAMTFYGAAGPMVNPVAACATAAVSVEVGADLIRAGKAEFVVAGGADDLCVEGARGFADMQATIDAKTREARGLPPTRSSRPCDARRGGFVEAQGGGALLLCRADKAIEMGLPIYGLVAGAWSFGDGLQRSVPAPGPGLTAVAQPLRRALRALGLNADAIGAVSIHGTSTAANDVNETAIHAQIAADIGRTPGLPLPVIAQKALTGHSKGGAAAWQMNGVLQAMQDGVIPAMRNLDEPDAALRDLHPLVYPDAPIQLRPGGLEAALVTSLGFGHVGACVCLAHPDVLLRRLDAAALDAYRQRRDARWRARLEAEYAVLLGDAPAVTLRTPAEASC